MTDLERRLSGTMNVVILIITMPWYIRWGWMLFGYDIFDWYARRHRNANLVHEVNKPEPYYGEKPS